MITYLHYQDWIDVLVYISPDQSSSALWEIVCTARLLPQIQKTSINAWSELRTSTQNDDIFSDAGDDNIYLVDCRDLKIATLTESVIARISGQIYLYSSVQEKVLADAKKILKNYEINYVEIKPATIEAKKTIAQEHIARAKLTIDAKTLETIVTKSASLAHVIDILDMIALSDYNTTAVLAQVFHSSQTPAYMLPFRLQDAQTSLNPWVLAISAPEEVQLGLSLLLTKIAKSGATPMHKKALSAVIQTDFLLKTQSIAPVTAFRLLLWRLKNMARVEADL